MVGTCVLCDVYYNLMGPPCYVRYVVDLKVVIRRMTAESCVYPRDGLNVLQDRGIPTNCKQNSTFRFPGYEAGSLELYRIPVCVSACVPSVS